MAEVPFQQVDSGVVAQVASYDSSAQVRGTSFPLPEVTCLLLATPGMKLIGPFTCTPERRH